MRNAIVLSAAAALLAGCGRSPSTSRVAGTVAGISCEVRGGAGGVTQDVRGQTRGTSHADRGTFAAGTNKLVVEEGRVVANGKAYGTAKAGDSVLLDEQGRLYVNGQERQPAADRAPDTAPTRKGD